MNWNSIVEILNSFLLLYTIVLLSWYFILAYISIQETNKHSRKAKFTDYTSILSSPLCPTVSIIAPAYNESLTIVDNVKSLLNLHYANYDVIVVNDGSTDNSMELLIDVYKLEQINLAVNNVLDTQPIRGVYKSTIPGYQNLYVVDKENGGKADALNVGLNISVSEYVACIDVDCILEPDAILKLVKPFLESGREKTIATGGVIRIANSCKVEYGRITEVNLPKNIVSRFQVLEYVRAFMLGRMAWARLDGLIIISGAFGMFDRKVAVEAGGYDHNTVGEDMELVVRCRRFMHEQGINYRVAYIPDPLCWTESPSDVKSLLKQRNRWTRGTVETLWLHRKMLFNVKYGKIGLISMPYWLLFEWLAPIIEFFGTLYFIFLIAIDAVDWYVALSILVGVYTFSIMYSLGTIYFEEKIYHQYNKRNDFFKLILLAFLEFFVFHPIVVWGAILGNLHILLGKKGWGKVKRSGFDQST